MNKTYYHYTTKENAEKIIKDRYIKAGDYGVYACDSLGDLFEFVKLYIQTGAINLDEDVVIQFIPINDVFEEGDDHNREIIKAESYVSYEDVELLLVKETCKVSELFASISDELLEHNRMLVQMRKGNFVVEEL